ncbi:ethylene receptor 2-like isoform X2 [Typha angustifolia]|uniref:ethylene receptor 2-like isoform X2 n=1 Tax=Typha angustifolia TaxID=59011 RepID=UPI003C2E45E2
MLTALCRGLVIFSLMFSSSAFEIGFSRCNCHGESLWNIESIILCQRVSDFFIAGAYFSIPLELLYFATCSNLFPFKWIVFQFGAFIVLCGLTHLLTVFTYEQHSFLVMLSLTISKFFTALVSFATAITLLTLIPQLLRVKEREILLMLKAQELDHEVGLMKRQEEARWHVRMLTQEIRKSLNRHTILYTTLVELSNTLGLQNCAVWMPEDSRDEMILTHELRQRSSLDLCSHSIPINDPDVREIREKKGVKILSSDSVLGFASSGGTSESGSVSAIRMPMLNVSDFRGGTPEVVQARYAILVLVLPRDDSRVWSYQELEIVEVVADQVAVALSHAAVLEESQLMRDKLIEQNRALLQEKQIAMMATEARNSFQRAMTQGMRKPMHSIMGLLSMMQQQELSPEKRLVVNTILKTCSVVSTLINDVMDISTINIDRLSLAIEPFDLHSMIKEAVSVARCLCCCKGISFGFQVESSIPQCVVGNEKRVFHVILHIVSTLIKGCDEGSLTFHALSYGEVDKRQDLDWAPWKMKSSDCYTIVKFEFGINRLGNSFSSCSSGQVPQRLDSEGFDTGLSFSMCKKIVQMMQGNVWAIRNSQGLVEIVMLVLQFQLQPPTPVSGGSMEPYRTSSTPKFEGLRVLLADNDDSNRTVTRKLLGKLGCHVSSVSSGIQCLSSLGSSELPFQLVILGLDIHNMDGFELARRIRKFRSQCWPSIVALTASAENDVWERCLQSGINGLIRKPVTLQAMGDELYRVLQNT